MKDSLAKVPVEVAPRASSGTARHWYGLFLLLLGAVLAGSLGVTVVSLTHGKSNHLIVSDGKLYYAWVRSVLIDHDLDFRNDYQLLCPPDPLPTEIGEVTPKGLVVNKYPVGMAILEIPGFLLAHVITRIAWPSKANGVWIPYQVCVAWSLIVFYMLSFYLLFRVMLILGVTPGWAFAFGATALLGTNVIHYIAKEPAMAHLAGVATFNLTAFLIVRPGEKASMKPAEALLWGALAGLMFLIRNTNVFLLPVLIALVLLAREIRWGVVAISLVGFVLIALIQPLSLYFLWGTLRLSTYPHETFSAGLSGVAGVLFSHRHGLFVYHPWYLVLISLTAYAAFAFPQRRPVILSALAATLMFIVANGTWWCWWFGFGFGNRAFIELMPTLSIAGALAISQARLNLKARVALVTVMSVLILVNCYLWLGHLLQAYSLSGDSPILQVYGWVLNRL